MTMWIGALGVLVAAVLTATPAGAVDYRGISPEAFSADYVKASELAAAGRYEDATAILRNLIEARPSDPDALNLLGYSLRKSGYLDRAEHFYLKALAIAPDHLGANQYLGELYVQRGDLANARARLEVLDAVCVNTCAGRDELAAAVAAAAAGN